MSNWDKKIEYKCFCGQNYGSCGEVGKFFIKYEGVSNIYQLFAQPHPDDKILRLGYFDDESLNALGIFLTAKHDDLIGCSSEEVSIINKTI